MKILLGRCQRDFESPEKESPEEERPEKEGPEEQNDDSAKKINSKATTGLVKFIGELYNFGVANARIVHSCIKDLLKRSGEESLDLVCVLLKAAGKKLEQTEGLISLGN